jgi:hypothetical protein
MLERNVIRENPIPLFSGGIESAVIAERAG